MPRIRKKSSKKVFRFTRLRLENWRNFKRVDVPLGKRAFLVGPNASGKSNFLDAFRFLQHLVAVGGGFQEAVTGRGGVSSIRCLAARQQSDIIVAVDLESADGENQWRYEIQFHQDNRRRPMLRSETVFHNGVEILRRPDQNDSEDPERLTQTYLEQVHANQRFREVTEYFQSIRYLHIVPQLIREPDRSIGKHNDPFGGDFIEQIAAIPEKTQKARLRKIERGLRIAVPQLQELELYRDPIRGTPHLRGKYEHWRPQGKWQSEEDFSDGTLRLLGLLWAVLDGTGPLLLEEPELSLHSEVVRQIPQMFSLMQSRSGRQILVSTHSVELLQDQGVRPEEVLLLQPSREGTAVYQSQKLPTVGALLAEGLPLAEAVLPYTAPREVQQLALFDR